MIKGNKETVILSMLAEEVKKLIPVIAEEGKKAWAEIKENTKEQVNDFVVSLGKANAEFRETASLDSAKLMAIVKENKVAEANEVYVWKKQYDDGIYINLAYGKNEELLEKDKNKFIIIKSEVLSEDLLDMFEESELIILE